MREHIMLYCTVASLCTPPSRLDWMYPVRPLDWDRPTITEYHWSHARLSPHMLPTISPRSQNAISTLLQHHDTLLSLQGPLTQALQATASTPEVVEPVKQKVDAVRCPWSPAS